MCSPLVTAVEVFTREPLSGNAAVRVAIAVIDSVPG
jgi:hypothetical protein